jgi:glycogen debranching enzyme
VRTSLTTRAVSTPGKQIAKYTVGDDEMAAGSTIGAPKAMIVLKATGAIEKFYSPELGKDVFNTLVLHHWDELTKVPLTARRGTFDIYPERQSHQFTLSNGVAVTEDVFLLNGVPTGERKREIDPPAAYYRVRLHNETGRRVSIATYASLQMRGSEEGKITARYEPDRNGFVVCNDKSAGAAAFTSRPAADSSEITLDFDKASAAEFPGALSGATIEQTPDRPLAILHFSRKLEAGERAEFTLLLTFSLDGEEELRRQAAELPDAEDALRRTSAHYDELMGHSIVLTPDEQVNLGVLWAKANVVRVQHLTQQGWCFTNDPARSSNAVARDTVWYSFGADYLTPEFTREALLWFLEHLERSGMVVEYFDIRTGKTADYGLNVNDNSPLLILGLWHHYCVTGDGAFLKEVYPRAARVAKFLLSQRNEQGLVWCKADGTADWGIIGWRNVIEGYTLSGATTEVNSECYAALKTMANMAQALGEHAAEQTYAQEAEDLKRAINEHLFDKRRNLYYLNIDLNGKPRTDVTCDLVFPVLFGVAERDTVWNIISRLSAPEFWSEAGLHTVPRNAINYSPTYGYGLFGGVWGGPTFWFASAAAPVNPEFMAYALSTSFGHYTSNPRQNNTVPGQFCEWLHGETLTNQGMMLSPWFAPKYLWAVLEGAGGLQLNATGAKIAPRLGSQWQWLAARNVKVHGKAVSWCTVRTNGLRTYATHGIQEIEQECVYDEDVSDRAEVRGDTAVCVAFRRAGGVVIIVGNTLDRTVNVGLTFAQHEIRGTSTLRVFSTLSGEWTERHDFDPEVLARGFPLQIGQHGFCVLELHKAA